MLHLSAAVLVLLLASQTDLRGDIWRRKGDKLGAAFVSNAISGDHQEYLKLGGLGLLLGDGNPNCGRGVGANVLAGY